MNTREIIQGLTICTKYGTMGGQNCRGHFEYAETEKGFDIVRKDNHNDECPYDGCKTGCVVTLATDAAAALKAYAEARAQEPRVMSLDEVKAIKSCWIEDEDAGIVYPAIYEGQGNPSEKGMYAVFVIKPDSDVLPEDCDDGIVCEFDNGDRWLWEADINRTWRPWNMCPTETQMEATPWQNQ